MAEGTFLREFQEHQPRRGGRVIVSARERDGRGGERIWKIGRKEIKKLKTTLQTKSPLEIQCRAS